MRRAFIRLSLLACANRPALEIPWVVGMRTVDIDRNTFQDLRSCAWVTTLSTRRGTELASRLVINRPRQRRSWQSDPSSGVSLRAAAQQFPFITPGNVKEYRLSPCSVVGAHSCRHSSWAQIREPHRKHKQRRNTAHFHPKQWPRLAPIASCTAYNVSSQSDAWSIRWN